MQLSIRYKAASDPMLRTYTGNTKVRKHDPETHYMIARPVDTSYIQNWDDVLDSWEQLWATKKLNGEAIESAILMEDGKWNGKVMIASRDAGVPHWTPRCDRNTPLHELLGKFYVKQQLADTTPHELDLDINIPIPMTDEGSDLQAQEAEPQASLEGPEMAGSSPMATATNAVHSEGTVGEQIIGDIMSDSSPELYPEVAKQVVTYDPELV